MSRQLLHALDVNCDHSAANDLVELRPDQERLSPQAAGRGRLQLEPTALVPGLIGVGLMLAWAVHDGGYDADTWYWGALLLLGTVAAVLVGVRAARLRLSTLSLLALGAFGAYVAFSYLSIAWAGSPGDALQGSNRALLYLFVFALFLV